MGELRHVKVPKTTLWRCSIRTGQDVQAFEHEDAEAETPAADRIVVGIDGTGVPMRACEVEGVAGKQEDGTAKTREAKTITCCPANGRNPKTGEPRKDKGSGADGVRIDSARASDFAARLDRFGTRNGLFEAKELVVLSDGAAWIRKVCEEVFAGRDAVFVLDLFHALEYVAAANRDMPPGESGRTARMDRFKERMVAGQGDQAIAELKPHRHSSEAVAACIDDFEANKDRMRCDLYRKRGVPVGAGIVESACKQIVGSRFKRAGCAAGRKRAQTPCSPSNAASRTIDGPTSSIGGTDASQQPEPKKMDCTQTVRPTLPHDGNHGSIGLK